MRKRPPTEAALQRDEQDYIEQAASQYGAPGDRSGEEQSLAGCSHLGHGSSAQRQFGRLQPCRRNPAIDMKSRFDLTELPLQHVMLLTRICKFQFRLESNFLRVQSLVQCM